MRIGLILLGICFSAFAELPATIRTSEATLDEDYRTKVIPFLQTAVEGSFRGVGQAKIFFRKFEQEPGKEKGAVVLVTGWTETSQKYAEIMYNLFAAGYSIYSADNRGMGLSQRLAPNPLMTHVEHFNDFVSDLKKFMDTVVKLRSHDKTFLLAHSTGGLISALYATKYPWDINGVVASAPLLRINTGHFPESVAYAIASSAIAWGGAKKYVLTHGDEKPTDHMDFAKQQATHSHARHLKKVDLWKLVPQSFMSGSSNRWLQRGLEATWWMHNTGAAQVEVPFLVFTADKDDRVYNPGVAETCRRMKNCTNHVMKDCFHELFIERDSIRDLVLDETLSFFARH